METALTVYDKLLIERLGAEYSEATAMELIEELLRRNLLDHKRCKALMVQEFVDGLVKKGEMKTDAMYEAAERFCCSYDCIRKYVYYYRQ